MIAHLQHRLPLPRGTHRPQPHKHRPLRIHRTGVVPKGAGLFRPRTPHSRHLTDTSGSAITQAPPTTDTSAPAANATQPPPATDTSAPATTVASIDTTAAPVDTSVSATTVATTATTVPPTDTTASATATALAQVPTGTPVVVLDATGTAVPLATQAAAEFHKE